MIQRVVYLDDISLVVLQYLWLETTVSYTLHTDQTQDLGGGRIT